MVGSRSVRKYKLSPNFCLVVALEYEFIDGQGEGVWSSCVQLYGSHGLIRGTLVGQPCLVNGWPKVYTPLVIEPFPMVIFWLRSVGSTVICG